MAKIKTPLFAQIRGKEKNVEFRTMRLSGMEVGKRRKPYNPQTPAQTSVRNRYGQMVQEWRAKTEEQKREYNALASGSGISGWNWYVKEEFEIGNIYGVVGTTDIAISSGIYADMAEMEISETFPGGLVLILGSCTINNDDAFSENAMFRITVDDVGFQATTENIGSSDFGALAIVAAKTLSTGAHTIKLQWAAESDRDLLNSAGTNPTMEHRALSVIVI